MLGRQTSGADPVKLFFFFLLLSEVILQSIIFFLFVMNTQAYQQKAEKLFVSEEIKFYRIGYWKENTTKYSKLVIIL